ncbi:hypothetical protein EYE40_06420 [Glaciihabitans arcticus]|uniref:Uncharacterized protein n=1 Tax=Glaciihabitans arcticus TaxID=2668039 RepID=A0A4Q9GWJ0_9MICO|nr:hypothetical protein [Glaciihabitans arcticus]TBN57063.1 hypothetical protein EYE40_06420 [Glaciihabitans arcticus]
MSDDKPTPADPEDTPTERFTVPGSEQPSSEQPSSGQPSSGQPSADLPTERFDAPPGSDLPTERFDAQPGSVDAGSYDATRIFPAAPTPAGNDRPTELIQRSGPPLPPASASAAIAEARAEPKSRALMYTLIAIAGVLLVGIIVLLVLTLSPGTGTPEATTTPTAAPTVTPTPEVTPTTEPTPVESVAPPAAPGPVFDAFTAPESAGCVDGDITRPLLFTWAGSGAETAYIGIATTDAKAAPYESDLPTTFRYDNLTFDCTLASQVYTVTLEDAAGLLTHRTVTVLK